MNEFFSYLAKTIIKTFSGKNIFAHLLAFALTAIIVLSGFDWYYFTHLKNLGSSYFLFPAVILGGIVPIVVPVYLLATSILKKNNERKGLGMSLAVSAVAGSIISSFYKSLTGRIQPDRGNLLLDISHQFNFGFMKHGFFWGWPSSHTTIAFAMAFTLITLFPK
ncbi:MAG: phosphatase PAP2 family protein, partial [Minisyncoccia bacterium]